MTDKEVFDPVFETRNDLLAEALGIALQFVPVTEPGENPEVDRIHELVKLATDRPRHVIDPVAACLDIDGKLVDPFILDGRPSQQIGGSLWNEPNIVKLYTMHGLTRKQINELAVIVKGAEAIRFVRTLALSLGVDLAEDEPGFSGRLLGPVNEALNKGEINVARV